MIRAKGGFAFPHQIANHLFGGDTASTRGADSQMLINEMTLGVAELAINVRRHQVIDR